MRLILGLTVIAILSQGCAAPDAQSTALQLSETPPAPNGQEQTVSPAEFQRRWEALTPLEREAYMAGVKFFEANYRQCGEDWFVKYVYPQAYGVHDTRPRYLQIHQMVWDVKGEEILYLPLTEADRLNRITRPYQPVKSRGGENKYVGEWEGEIRIGGSAYRDFNYLHDPPPPNPVLHFGKGPFPPPPPAPTPGPGEWLPWKNADGPYGIESYRITRFDGKWTVGIGQKLGASDIVPIDCSQIPQASLKVSQVPDPTPPPIKNPASPVPATVVAEPMVVPPNARILPPKALPKKSP